MDWKKTSLALGVGIAAGVVFQREVIDRKTISPEKALKSAKSTVGQRFDIDGSWVHMQPEAVERYGLDYEVYEGGITVSTRDQVRHYNFLVDAVTGTVVEFTPDD